MSKKNLNEENIIDLVKKITFKTIGCTEPVAIALAVAKAYKEIGGEIKLVTVSLDKNVYKNAMAVGIPGTNLKGLQLAIALGLVCGDPSKSLLLLENATDEDVINAKKILTKNIIQIILNEEVNSLNIEVKIQTTNDEARVIIAECHDNIVLIEKNGKVTFHKIFDPKNESLYLDQYNFGDIKFDDLIKTITNIPEQKIAYLLEGYELNKKAAEIGLKNSSGMGLGSGYKRLIDQGILSDDNFINKVKMVASAAVDARMGGVKVPVFGCAGSGNHGIMFFITVGMCFEKFRAKNSISLLHVYTIGLVILAAIKQKLGLLSSICGGALAAGTAAAAAITYILGGNSKHIINAINLMFGNIAGMICDGAKYGCAIKISSGVACAIESAMLAINDVNIPISDGIIGKDFDETIYNVGLLNSIGMREVDRTVLEMLKSKQRNGI